MCPLRLILIFLSAALAGFFIFRNLKSAPPSIVGFGGGDRNDDDDDNDNDNVDDDHVGVKSSTSNNKGGFLKAKSAIESAFWTCVDMASGRYLWRHLVSSSSSSSAKPSD